MSRCYPFSPLSADSVSTPLSHKIISSHSQSLGCIAGVVGLLLATNPTSPAPPPALVPLGLAGYILPLCTNVMVTSLIVYRIWSSSRSIPDSPFQIGQGATRRAIILVIESGALYLLFQFVFVILFAVQNPAEGILAPMAVQIYVSNELLVAKLVPKRDTLTCYRESLPH